MTVIAWDGRMLAADKMATNAGLNRTVTKIWKPRPGLLLAIAGDFSVAVEMREWFLAGADPKEFPSKARDDVSSLIVVTAHGYAKYESGPYPLPFDDTHMAIGSGRDYAIAAMHLGLDAMEAVRVACLFDVNCGNGVDVLTLD